MHTKENSSPYSILVQAGLFAAGLVAVVAALSMV